MRFVLANEKLIVEGRSFAGFPLVLDDRMLPLEPAQTFLWWLLARGRRSSKSTWENYGRAIFDYFAFVTRNKIEWRGRGGNGMPGPVEAYRDWSIAGVGLSRRTLNNRLRVVVRFYKWALKNGYIEAIPFDFVLVKSGRPGSIAAHGARSDGLIESPTILLRESNEKLEILTKEQVLVCIDALKNRVHRAMFLLMCQIASNVDPLFASNFDPPINAIFA